MIKIIIDKPTYEEDDLKIGGYAQQYAQELLVREPDISEQEYWALVVHTIRNHVFRTHGLDDACGAYGLPAMTNFKEKLRAFKNTIDMKLKLKNPREVDELSYKEYNYTVAELRRAFGIPNDVQGHSQEMFEAWSRIWVAVSVWTYRKSPEYIEDLSGGSLFKGTSFEHIE